MSKTDKLLEKLRNGTIDYREMVTLLERLGWEMRGQKGSHQRWAKDSLRYTLTAAFPKYQLKDMRDMILGDEK